MTDQMRHRCDKCNYFVDVQPGVNALWSRGYWWCLKHAKIFEHEGRSIVEFPSEGMLIPETIMIEIPEAIRED